MRFKSIKIVFLSFVFSCFTIHAQSDEMLEQGVKTLDYFAKAYAQYPDIPSGYLESLAFVNTRWLHIKDSQHEKGHDEMDGHTERPRVIGIMGLHMGDHGYRNLLSEAAEALSVNPKVVADSEEVNILATAALVSELMKKFNLSKPRIEQMALVSSYMLGSPNHGEKSEVSKFIEDSYFYDQLLSLDRGYDDGHIFIIDQKIEWNKAFNVSTLGKLQAPTIRLNPLKDEVYAKGVNIDVQSESYQPQENSTENKAASPDYPSANWIASPYYGNRSRSINAVTIHTTQGSYAGTLNWFQNNPYSVSAHYVIRSSDGQVTQMVRESKRAHHVGVHNSRTLGIEHEGFVNNPAWYTSAMYNASANLTKHFCRKYSSLNCNSAYRGPAHSGVVVLSDSIQIRGHQHFSSQSHTDPGIHWNWSHYHSLLNGGSGGGGGNTGNLMLDNFERSEGRFNTSPNYSGSTRGISSQSFAERTNRISRRGNYSEHIQLRDNPNTNASWAVRFLSASGRPSGNPKLNKSGGRIGFWVLAAASGVRVGVSVDDNDGTERSTTKALTPNVWTYVEWRLDNSSQWNAWVGGNGVLSSQVSLDAIWLYRNQTSYTVNVYIDDVQYRNN